MKRRRESLIAAWCARHDGEIKTELLPKLNKTESLTRHIVIRVNRLVVLVNLIFPRTRVN